MKRTVVVFIFLTQISISLLGQEVNWARHFDPEGNRYTDLTAITTNKGFTYALGHSRYSVAIEDPEHEAKLEKGFFLVKLDEEGNTVWKQNFTTEHDDWNQSMYLRNLTHDIEVDDDGNIYIAGNISSTTTFQGVDGPYELNIRDYSVNDSFWQNQILPFIARFNEQGELEDIKILAKIDPETGTNRDIPYLNMIMDNDKIYVAASYQYSIILDPGTSNEQLMYSRGNSWSSAQTFFIASYSKAFELIDLIDIRQPENLKNEIGTVKLKKAETGIHAMVNFKGTLTINQGDDHQNIHSGLESDPGSFAGALIHFDDNGNYLNHKAFLQTYSTGPGNGFYDLSTDKDGNIYVAGTVRTVSQIGNDEDQVSFTSAAVNRPVIIKFDADYNYQWLRTFHGASPIGVASPGGEGRFVECLEGGCVLAGDSGANFRIYDYENTEILYNGDQNAAPYLMMFDENGDLVQFLVMKVKNNFPQFSINGHTTLKGFHATSDHNVIVAGRFSGEITIGSSTFVATEQSILFDKDLFISSLDLSVYEPPLVTLTTDNSSINEKDGVATVTASLSQQSSRDVSIALLVEGTANNGVDYQISSTSMVIPAGDLTSTITVTAIDDELDEDEESIALTISEVTNGTFESNTIGITIIDDDDDIVVSLDKSLIASRLKIGPNPAQDQLNITLPNTTAQWTNVAITDTNGITLLSVSPLTGESEMVLDVKSLRYGVYFLILQNSNLLIRKKIMILR